MAEAQSAEVDAEIGGQKLKYSGPVNTLFTILTFVAVVLVVFGGYTHMQDTRAASSELVFALKDQTQALREGNCLATYQGPTDQRALFCKQVTR